MRTGRMLTRPALWISLLIPLALLFTIILGISLSRVRVVAQPTTGVEVDKQVSATQAGPGDILTYTIHVWDSEGEPTYDAWLTDTLADGLMLVSGGLTATYGTFGFMEGVITWTGDLGNVWITFTAQISPDLGSTTIVNTAEITGAGALFTDSVATVVSPGFLEASKSVVPAAARLGEQLVYTVWITNTGNGSVENAWMTDSLPSEVVYADGLSATGGNWGAADNVVTWTGTLAPAESVVITFTAQITSTLSEETVFTNTAEITGTGSLIQASVAAVAMTEFRVYLPLVLRNYPPVPLLNPIIPTPWPNSSYTVSWQLDSPYVDHFVLQESTNANFVPYTGWETTSNSRYFEKGTTCATFYYRVRADGEWGEGPWSNVQSVTTCYFDDFSNPASGWPQFERLIIPSTQTYIRGRYENNQYRIMIDPGGPDIWFRQPSALAPYRPPTDKYCIQADIKFMKRQPPYDPPDGRWNFYPYWANAGLIFGTNEANTDLFAVCLAIGGEISPGGDAYMGWYIVHNTNSQWPYEGCHAGGYGIVPPNGYESSGLNTANWYRFQVSVNGNQASLHLNGVYKGSWTLSGLSDTTRVGVTGGPYEVTPVDIRFDNFMVVPYAACTPSAP